MHDNKTSRRYFAQVAANWIINGSTVTCIETKRHTRNPYVGVTPYYCYAIRNSNNELSDIDVPLFCDLLGAKHPYPESGFRLLDVLKEAGYTCYSQDDILVVIDKLNPLLTANTSNKNETV